MAWPIEPSPKKRFTAWLAAVPEWMFLSAGLAIVVGTLLLPPWLSNHKLAWQLDVMQQQAAHLAQQESSFGELLAALEIRDPVMLERLAYEYLRLKPVGATVLTVSNGVNGFNPIGEDMWGDMPGGMRGDMRGDMWGGHVGGGEPLAPMAIESWIAKPMPYAGAYEPIRSKLVTTTTGPKRTVLLVAGLLLIVIALLPPPHTPPPYAPHA